MATDIEAQFRGENQEAKWAGIAARDLPVETHCIPHACQPTASYDRLANAQGVK
jgi:hypothetical protein